MEYFPASLDILSGCGSCCLPGALSPGDTQHLLSVVVSAVPDGGHHLGHTAPSSRLWLLLSGQEDISLGTHSTLLSALASAVLVEYIPSGDTQHLPLGSPGLLLSGREDISGGHTAPSSWLWILLSSTEDIPLGTHSTFLSALAFCCPQCVDIPWGHTAPSSLPGLLQASQVYSPGGCQNIPPWALKPVIWWGHLSSWAPAAH